ncbi:energy transducer TonB [Govanella unica]|uniref:Energy transducer TonB n=1 Tax=Govanella unica TaxID=2975056 RepID=A0A9X3TYG7_9PROT|nr:energy transducer TonB [Govania unica]MDA5194007.1 energy transducer TonB [Govania unica]
MSRLSATRLSATACAALVHVAVAAAALWVTSAPKAAPEPPIAIKIKLTPPAPEIAKPVEETPPPPKPEPTKTEKAKPRPPEPTPAPQPLPELASTADANPSSRAVESPAPTPPKAIESVSDKAAKADYYATLLGWLDQHKDYPREARVRREQGVAQLYFRMNRDGRVLSYRLEASSGHASLDDATIRMIERANPLPPFPPEMKDAELELVVPVEFFLSRGKKRG